MDWYIESLPNEPWQQVSSLFAHWVQVHSTMAVFGYSEGDAVVHAGKTYLCFSVPADYSGSSELFEAWARTTPRAFGEAAGGAVILNTGESIRLPPAPCAKTWFGPQIH